MNLFNSTPLPPPIEAIQKYYKDHQELNSDSLYVMITLGSVHLLYLKLQNQLKEESERLKFEGKAVPAPLIGAIKISFKEEGIIKIEEPGLLTQTLPRLFSGEGRAELGLIRPHLIKFLRWYNYQTPISRIFIMNCKKGLENILEGYRGLSSRKFTISGSNQSKSKLSAPIEIKTNNSEIDLIVRVLRQDIDLLQEALEQQPVSREKIDADKSDDKMEEISADNDKAKFDKKIQEEEKRYFPMHQLPYENSTIDQYLCHSENTRWDQKTIEAIGRLFQSENDKRSASNQYEAIASLIKDIPFKYFNEKESMRGKITSSLSHYHLEEALT